MANKHLFLKSGFIRAPLENGLGRYIDQLQRVTIKFCKNNSSSSGVRDFIENDLVNFAKENPGVVVYVKPRRHRTPVLVAEYLNGDRQWKATRNFTSDELGKWLNLLKTQNGDTSSIRYRKHLQTSIPSIQGPWTPFLHKNPPENIVTFPDNELGEVLDKPQTATLKLLEIVKARQIQAKEVSSEQ